MPTKSDDLAPEIAARAYELYQERLHGESQQDQDWLEAEREIAKDHAEPQRLREGPREFQECSA